MADLFNCSATRHEARILYALLEAGEMCVCDISETVEGSRVHRMLHALRLLRTAGVASGNRRDGRHGALLPRRRPRPDAVGPVAPAPPARPGRRIVNRATVAPSCWKWCSSALAFGWRSWVQWRRTSSTGFFRHRHGASTAELVGSIGFVLALVLLVAAPIADLVGMARVTLLDTTWAAAAGFTLGVGGVLLTLVAQLAMGDSWRIGVDPATRTDLVTDGVFASVRNPIFTAMIVATVGPPAPGPQPDKRSCSILVLVAALRGPGAPGRRSPTCALSTDHAYDAYSSHPPAGSSPASVSDPRREDHR